MSLQKYAIKESKAKKKGDFFALLSTVVYAWLLVKRQKDANRALLSFSKQAVPLLLCEQPYYFANPQNYGSAGNYCNPIRTVKRCYIEHRAAEFHYHHLT